MKVQTLLLGYFSDEKPVHVYRLTNQVLYKLSDISLLFGLPHLPQHPTLSTNLLSNNSPHCYRDNQDLYLSTKLLGEIAISLNKYQLAEFCKFKPNDYTAGLADSILDSMSRFERVKKMGQWKGMDLPGLASASSSSIDTITSSHNTKNNSNNNNNRIPFTTNTNTTTYSPPTTLNTSQESTPPSLRRNEKRSASNNNNNNNNDEHDSISNQRKSSPLVKTEPLSPPPSFVPASPTRDQNSNSDSTNPMALNSVLMNGDRRRSGSAADDQHQLQGSNKRQRVDNSNENGSSSTTTSNNNKRQSYRSVLPKPMHTVGSQSSSNAPSTLLSKRLQSKQGKNTRHLTIFAPSYNNQPALGIRSAPLNTNFFQQQQQLQHQHQQPPGTSGNGLIQPPTLPSSHHQHPHHQLRHAHQPGVNHHPPLHTAGGNSNQHSSHHHHQQQQKGYYYGQGPSTSLPQSSQAPRMSMLHPGHTLAPLLSPRAPIPSQHREAASQRLSPRSNKQEFAIPPIVPSQQQPPLTAHPSSTAYYPYMASPMYQRNSNNTSGSNNNSGNNNNSSGSSGSSSNNGNSNQHHPPVTGALPTTAREVPLPPQTPTTNSFGSLQRQQFLQPFEHLFETIETSRTLKTTLDDQIRRSSTLMQTLQASSTTIEGLVRNQIKEAQKEMMAEMDATFENILQRIEKLERVEGKEHLRQKQGQEDEEEEEEEEERRRVGIETPPPPVPTSATTLSSHKNKRRQDEEEQGEDDNNNGEPSSSRTTKSNGFLRSPPTIVRSQNDIGPNEYHGLLNALRERLDRLERQFDN
ncbi:hypothetical protein INT45_002113 [Circinella minor]|uniref:Uncharacterized protein n=1 Tax=Circinella minor TaxID=1195481 RepID=A0A8H7SE24_9FUNG|nr:hypothetical protein INT45_002113 [Circinella minor]